MRLKFKKVDQKWQRVIICSTDHRNIEPFRRLQPESLRSLWWFCCQSGKRFHIKTKKNSNVLHLFLLFMNSGSCWMLRNAQCKLIFILRAKKRSRTFDFHWDLKQKSELCILEWTSLHTVTFFVVVVFCLTHLDFKDSQEPLSQTRDFSLWAASPHSVHVNHTAGSPEKEPDQSGLIHKMI